MDCGSSSSSSGWEEELEAVAAFVVLDEEENKTKTREWVHAINKKRETLGEFHRLVPELKKDTKRFHMYFRMTMEEFDFLHELIKPDIYKQNTQFRRAVSTEARPFGKLKIFISELRKKIIEYKLYKHIRYSDLQSVRKAMYDKRRKKYPVFPTSFNEAISQLKLVENDFCFGDQFIFVPENDEFFFGDGTFDYALIFFLKLYTIHSYTNGFYVPIVYFFLANKTKETYLNMWKYLLELCQQFFTSTLDVQKLYLDFEAGAYKAAKEIFPTVMIVTCCFHLGQAWWRKINGDSNLRNVYNDNNNELSQWLKLFFGLPFLPSDKIEDAFLALIAECPSLEEGDVFTDYLVSTYIAPDALFPSYLWAQEPSVNPRYDFKNFKIKFLFRKLY
ncbi:hypothetical protein QTP88_002993 [Uroleucon formosanum]